MTAWHGVRCGGGRDNSHPVIAVVMSAMITIMVNMRPLRTPRLTAALQDDELDSHSPNRQWLVPSPSPPREHELMHYVTQALSNRQIAIQLGSVEGTAKRHLRNIFAKWGATSRIDAANRLRELQQGYEAPRSGQEATRQPSPTLPSPRPMP